MKLKLKYLHGDVVGSARGGSTCARGRPRSKSRLAQTLGCAGYIRTDSIPPVRGVGPQDVSRLPWPLIVRRSPSRPSECRAAAARAVPRPLLPGLAEARPELALP